MNKRLLITLLLISVCSSFQAQTIQLTTFASGFANPVDIAFAPSSDVMYVVQQRGRIRMVDVNGIINATDYINLSSLVSQSGSETGLLGLAFHPNYQNNGYFYVNYTRSTNGSTRISRFSRSATNPLIGDPTSELVLLEIAQPYSNHNGGCIRFGKDGMLYIGMGDGGSAGDPGNRAQNPTNLLGKMLRINVDGPSAYTIPTSNPYYGQTDTLPEIWAMGMRNPWKFGFDMINGNLWIADVGQNAFEEINMENFGNPGGKNYGWRCYEANTTYNTSGCQSLSNYAFPVAIYSHNNIHCSVTGGYVYRGASFADLYGKYINTDYCSGYFWQTYPNPSGGWITNQLNQFTNRYFSTFGQDHYGEIYVADLLEDKIFKVQSTNNCNPVAFVHSENNLSVICSGDSLQLFSPLGNGFTYQWYYNSAPVGTNSNILYASQPGNYSVMVTSTPGCTNTSASFTVGVSTTPSVQLTASDSIICVDGSPVTLSFSPSGGSLSGTAVLGNTFNPAISGVGVFPVVYSISNADGCVGSDTLMMTVPPSPTVNILYAPALYCIDSTAFTLTANIGGGNWSGPGVNGNSFDPSLAGLGTHQVIYSFTDNNGCTGIDSTSIEVIDACEIFSMPSLAIQQFSIFPNPSFGEMNLQLESKTQTPLQVSIITMDGQVLQSFEFLVEKGKTQYPINLNGIANGMYVIQLKTIDGIYNSKVVLK
jgi:glucose/arabinose dehydrogenase